MHARFRRWTTESTYVSRAKIEPRLTVLARRRELKSVASFCRNNSSSRGTFWQRFDDSQHFLSAKVWSPVLFLKDMSTSTPGPARASLYRQYSRGSSAGGSSSSIENLPPRTLSRVAREVRDLIKSPPEGIRLVVDDETGLPSNLGEIVVCGY